MRSINSYTLLILIAVGFACVRPASAEVQGAEQSNPQDKFKSSFSASFYGFDWCGDASMGALYRKAIVEKFDHCPFPKEAKDKFRAWSEDEAKEQEQAIKDYVAQNGKLPERLDGMKVSCAEQRRLPAYTQLAAALERFGRGQASFDTVISGPCGAEAKKK